MALAPNLRALTIGEYSAPHTLELWLDYLCPFSAKQLLGVNEHLLPLITGSSSPYAGKVRIVVRPYPQPWHATSTLLHESALAVALLAFATDPRALVDPTRNAFWQYSLELMRAQTRFFDGPARDKSANQIRAELVNLAVSCLGEAPKAAGGQPLIKSENGIPLGQSVKNLIRVEEEGNAGSKVVPDLKYCVKLGRQNGIHVTPTAAWNGLVEGSISSSFGEKEWKEFLDKQIGDGSKL